jgi:hypothetical protein
MLARRTLCFALAVVAAGCASIPPAADNNRMPADVQTVLDRCDEIELYSLDPARNLDTEKPKDEFHGWKVLGKTTLKTGDRKAVLAALNKGIKDSDGTVAACFNPRHGIKATHDGRTVELVICFECLSMQVNYGDGKTVSLTTTSTPQRAFDEALTDAKVPLPGQAEKK